MTRRGGTEVEANIQRHCEFSPPMIVVFWNATETMKPSMMPKAVHICHIMVRAPRILISPVSLVRVENSQSSHVLGALSALYTGVVLDLAPTANPRTKRAMSRLYHVSAAAIQKPVTTLMKQEMKIVPRRPNSLLSGAFVQHPIRAEQR